MTATMVAGNPDNLPEIRWPSMVSLSVCMHILFFCIILLVPEYPTSWHQIGGTVYEVNLVDMPSSIGAGSKGGRTTVADEKQESPSPDRGSQARRISAPEEKEPPLVVAKKTVNRTKSQPQKPKVSSSQLIDNAISKIEKEVSTEDSDQVEKALSELMRTSEVDSGGQAGTGDGVPTGIAIRIYQMEVESRIYGNWSYPVAIQDTKKLRAIVLLKVRDDGTIMECQFKQRSGDTIFNQSVLKAIEKSDPLPPLPEGYPKSHEEIEINFNLEDLE
jgi:colicin import membrane protein